MKITSTVLALLLAVFCSAAGELKFSEKSGIYTVEHPAFSCAVSSTGGKIISFIDRRTNKEIVDSSSTQTGGMGKTNESLLRDISPQFGEYTIKAAASGKKQLTLTAEWEGSRAAFKGIKIIRQFEFDSRKNYIKVTENIQAVSNTAEFMLQCHNTLQSDNLENAVFYSRNAEGAVRFSMSDLSINSTQVVIDPAVPWFGYVNGNNGLAFVFEKSNLLNHCFAWFSKTSKMLVTAVTLNKFDVAPVAERDIWHTSYCIVPFVGTGELLHADNTLTVCGKSAGSKTQMSVYLSESAAKGEVYAADKNNRVLASVPVKAGQNLYNLEFKSLKEQIFVGFRGGNGEVKAAVPGDIKSIKFLKASRKLPKTSIKGGTEGNYYYYKELYLSREMPVWVAFGMRGDFRKKKNLRFGLLLPPEVKYVDSAPRPKLGEQRVVVDGIPMIRHELEVFRSINSSTAKEIALQLTGPVTDKSFIGLQAFWKGGEQKLHKIKVLEIAKLPELERPLKHFSIGLEFRRGLDNWPIEKAGFNFLMQPRVEQELENHKGDGFYAEQISKLNQRGIRAAMSFLGPYKPTAVLLNQGKARKVAGTLLHPQKHYKEIDFSEFAAININGKPAAGSKNYMLVCPGAMTRGRYAEKTLDIFKTAIDYGFDHFVVDEEHWAFGSSICFCKNCIAEFNKRCKNAGLKIVDLKIVALNEKKYPAQFDIWWDMKTDQVAEIYKQIRHTIDNYRPNGKKRTLSLWVDRRTSLNSKRYSAIENRLSDYRKLAKYADALIPMCYEADSEIIRKTASVCSELIKGCRARLIMGISPNRFYEYNRVLTQDFAGVDALEQQILESCFSGAAGIMIWAPYSGLRGANGMLNTARAIKRILPVEDILYFGKDVKIACSNPAVTVTAREYKGQIALFLRNYSEKTMEAEITLPGNIKTVIDTFSGKEVKEPKFKFVGSQRIHTLLLK